MPGVPIFQETLFLLAHLVQKLVVPPQPQTDASVRAGGEQEVAVSVRRQAVDGALWGRDRRDGAGSCIQERRRRHSLFPEAVVAKGREGGRRQIASDTGGWTRGAREETLHASFSSLGRKASYGRAAGRQTRAIPKGGLRRGRSDGGKDEEEAGDADSGMDRRLARFCFRCMSLAAPQRCEQSIPSSFSWLISKL